MHQHVLTCTVHLHPLCIWQAFLASRQRIWGIYDEHKHDTNMLDSRLRLHITASLRIVSTAWRTWIASSILGYKGAILGNLWWQLKFEKKCPNFTRTAQSNADINKATLHKHCSHSLRDLRSHFLRWKGSAMQHWAISITHANQCTICLANK